MSQRPKFAATLPSPDIAISRPRIVPPSEGPSSQQPEPADRAASPDDQSIVQKALKACFQQRNTELRQWLELNIPDKTDEEFLAMLPKPEYDERWTLDDERRLVQEWGNHVLKVALRKKINVIDAFTASVKEEYALWRVSITFLNCLPTNIISDRRYGMMYESRFKINRQGSDLDGNLTQATRALWTQWFCKLLSKLTLHPAWEGNYRLYRTAIQYTVISATDDSRPWDCDVRGVDSVFLHAFSKAARETDGRRTFSSIHKTILGNLEKDYGNLGQTSWWSKLFKSIEDQTRKARRKVRQNGLSRVVNGVHRDKPYLVHSTDLAILEEAMRVADQVYGGNPPFTPEAWVRTVKAFTGGHKHVVNKELFENGMDAVWLNYLRMSRRSEDAETRAQRRNAPNNANSHHGDDDDVESVADLVDLAGFDEDDDSEDVPLMQLKAQKGMAADKGKAVDRGKSIDRTQQPGPGPSSSTTTATAHAAPHNPVAGPRIFRQTSQLRLPGTSAPSSSAFPAVRGFTPINSRQPAHPSYYGDDEYDGGDDEEDNLPTRPSLPRSHPAGDNITPTTTTTSTGKKIHRGFLPSIQQTQKRAAEDSGSDLAEDTTRPQKRLALPPTASGEYRDRRSAPRPAFSIPTAPMLNARLDVLAAVATQTSPVPTRPRPTLGTLSLPAPPPSNPAATPATRPANRAAQPEPVVYDIMSDIEEEPETNAPPHVDLILGPKTSVARRRRSK
ncbi:hypothetical protein B0T22DRAFT_436644 [Podospora appendiculata]|uniref:Uncharacterized protein n=1 Tax=Podospora appendiculata TaxID=314037 RepID=A0AAE0XHB5_9PEZI|nr:hypothetical protein B0T22DRAFT_436644 [Podospora appendiculata]